MSILLSLLGNKMVWFALLILGLSLAVGVQTHRLSNSKAETALVQSQFDTFKGGVAALGREAEEIGRAHV